MIAKQIVPVQIFPHTASRFAFSSASVNPDKSAQVFWQLQDDAGRCLQSGSVEMSGDDYSAWSDNDEHPLEFAAARVGVTIINE